MVIDKFILLSSAAKPFAFIMAVILIAGILQRQNHGGRLKTASMAALFSVSVILCMTDQIDLGFAGVHDLRGLLIGSAIALFGPVIGIATLLTGILMRLYLGGPGMLAGVAAMFLAFSGGWLWRQYVRGIDQSTLNKGIYLGCCVSIHVFALFLLPKDLWGPLFAQMAPFFLTANILGAILFNILLRNELAFASEVAVLKNDANTDPLTGLLNRRGLDVLGPEVTHDVVTIKGRAVLYLDVDTFKDVNDTFGHAAGDKVLRDIAQRITKRLRRSDIFARLGGDEFALLLPDVSQQQALRIVERCKAAVSDEAIINDEVAMPVTVSIGAIWQRNPTSMEAMLQTADTALYSAKSKGRNRVVFLTEIETPNRKARSGRTALVT